MMKDYKNCIWSCGQTINTFVNQLLGNTFELLLTSSQLPWQRSSSTERTSKFQFCKLCQKLSQWPTVFIALLESSLHSYNMTKRYTVDLVIFQKRHFFTYRKFYWITFSQTFYVKGHIECCLHAKNQDRSPRDFTLHFHFRWSARATFDRDFDKRVHLVYGVGGLRARTRLKTLSSL